MILARCIRCLGLLPRLPSHPSLQIRSISLFTKNLRTIKPPRSSRRSPASPQKGPRKNDGSEDAYTIAEKARELLLTNREEAVMRLIRQNHDLNLVVTWNYLILNKLKYRRLNAALRDFSSMKKHGHFPNAQTYTSIFTGLHDLYECGTTMDKLWRTVNKLLGDPRVRPSVIHLNAVLRVCVKAKDLTMGYKMLDRFKQAGMTTMDASTYDALFLIIRAELDKVMEPGNPKFSSRGDKEVGHEARKLLDDAVAFGREVEDKWHDGSLFVDARLLITYASVLRKGTKRDLQEAMRTLSVICGLDMDESIQALERSNRRNTKGKGELVGLNERLLATLLSLAELLKLTAWIDVYWKSIRNQTSRTLQPTTYEARLRSLAISTAEPEESRALLREMQQNDLPISPTAVFLALQHQLTYDKSDVASAVLLLQEHSHIGKPNFAIVSTLSRFMNAAKPDHSVWPGIEYFNGLDLMEMADSTREIAHQKELFREVIEVLRKRLFMVHAPGPGAKTLPLSTQRASIQLERKLADIRAKYYPRLRPARITRCVPSS